MGMTLAEKILSQHAGRDVKPGEIIVADIDGTVSQEKVYHDAGAATPQALSRVGLHQLSREAGRDPVERNTLY